MNEQDEIKFNVTEVAPATPVPMDVSDGLEIKTSNDMARISKMLLKSGMLPTRFDSEAKVIGALQYALELGFKPLTGLKNIAIVNGSPMIFAEAPLALVLRSGKLEWMVEHYLDKDMNEICMANKNLDAEVYASVTRTKRKGCEQIYETYFSLKEMETAGISIYDKYGKVNVWGKYTKLMLRYRARAANLKSLFADCLFNAAIVEYDSNEGFFESSKLKTIDSDKMMIDDAIMADITVKNKDEVIR